MVSIRTERLPLSVVVVEDSQTLAHYIQQALDREGYDVKGTFDSAEGALERIGQLSQEGAPPDLVVMDIVLNGKMNGLEAGKILSARYGLMLIYLTGASQRDTVEEAYKANADAYLLKPFNIRQLIATIEGVAKRRRLEKDLMERQARLREMNSELHAGIERSTQSNRFLQVLIDAIPVGVFYVNTNLIFEGCNRAFTEMFEVSKDTVIGKSAHDILPAEVAAHFRTMDLELVRHRNRDSTELQVQAASSGQRDLMIRKATFDNPDGSLGGIIGSVIDISEMKAIEALVQQERKLLKTVIEHLPEAVYAKNTRGEYMLANEALARMLGVGDANNLIGKTRASEIHPSDEIREELEAEILKTGEPVLEREISVTDPKTHELLWFMSSQVPLRDEEGNITGLVGLERDISEQKRSEQDHAMMEIQLRQAQKLEAIGQLAAGIAHEINTPAQFVGDNIRFVSDALKDIFKLLSEYRKRLVALESIPEAAGGIKEIEAIEEELDVAFLLEEAPKAVGQTLEGIQRISEIVKAMKDFSHPGTQEMKPFDINRSLESVVTVARNEWKYVADVELSLGEELPLVIGLPGELNQVFLNLIINAAHSIDDRIRQTGVQEKGRVTICSSFNTSQQLAEIRIQDTGTGIPEKIRNRIFDPFFTTKEVGKGTGQGLSISYDVVVRKHGGTLCFETEPGNGTTFIVRLPMRLQEKQEGQDRG